MTYPAAACDSTLLEEPDHYIQSAEMYDILAGGHWSARRDSVRRILREASFGADDWIVDVGSGTGTSVTVIAEARPSNPVLAVEPSASMRVGLMTRLLADPALRRRVSVRAAPFGQARLPETVGAFVACGCIGYLDEVERTVFWNEVARRLGPEGLALVDVMPITEPQTVPEHRIASAEVGSGRYDIHLRGEPVNHEIIRWFMRFEVFEGTECVRRFSIERDWRAFGLDRLQDEAARAGLRATPVKDSPVPAAIFTRAPA